MNLRRKPDADESLARMEAWWTGQNLDRPILSIHVSGPGPTPRGYADARAPWFDFSGRIEDARWTCANGTYVAESFPTFEPNLGPDILATVFGLDLEFADGTSWGTPICETLADVMACIERASFDAPLWQSVEDLHRRSIGAAEDLWIPLFTDLHPNADILSALMGPEAACIASFEDPDGFRLAIEALTPVCVEAYRRQVQPILDAGWPVGCWMRGFSARTTHVPCCDFSALIGPAAFEELVLPSIREEMTAAERNIYHLDGPDALRHLDALLEVPEIDAIQWVYGAGHGPARRWLDVYRKILDAGKAIRVEAEDLEDIATLHPILGPAGVWYLCYHAFRDEPEAREFMKTVS